MRSDLAAFSAFALLAACSTSGSGGESSHTLAGSSWRLAELQSSDDPFGVVRPDDPSKYQMTLGADGSATLRLDCNRGSGRWASPAASQIEFTPLAMTRAACPPGSLDTRVARELGYVSSYLLKDDQLRLILMADGGTQLWTRQARPRSP